MALLRERDPERGPADPRMALYLEGKHHPQRALPPRIGFVALDGDGLVGYIAGHRTRRYECDGELQYLYVAPPYRRSGVASALLRLLAEWFVAQGARIVCVDVAEDSPAARPFYVRHGAVELNRHWLVWRDIGSVLAPNERTGVGRHEGVGRDSIDR
jgi:GNAT superfamily N-acetyltransferase